MAEVTFCPNLTGISGFMKNMRQTRSDIISLLGMIATFAIAYGLDAWIASLRKLASQTFNPAPGMLVAIVSNFIMAAVLLLLSWFVIFQSEAARWIAYLFIIIGALVAIFPGTLFIRSPSFSWFRSFPLTAWLRDVLFVAGLGSHLFLSAAFLAMIGLFALIHQRRLSQ